ncbi:hypothetical protein, partial [Pseudomonas aeruginosa]|uniref:hypothetical protein n=1 Tax=Pseudomonas aeruginosa TaxID=287 RepID=UPI003CC5B2FF
MHLIDAISEGLELVLKRLEERIQPLPTLLGKALLLTIKDLIRKVLKLLFKLLLVLLEQLELRKRTGITGCVTAASYAATTRRSHWRA